MAQPEDLPEDPGLERTAFHSPRGPYVGRAHGVPERFAHDPRLDRLLRELACGFGAQQWWPAETPFEVLVGAILTQNTSWTNVERALGSLKARTALTPGRLLGLDEQELASCVRSSGSYRVKARKLHALCTWYLEVGGLWTLLRAPLEPLRNELLGVFGVGPETADSILCYGAGRRTPVVDAYTRRLLGRHGLVEADAPYEQLRGWLQERLVDSQAVYEEFHALCVRVGYDHCKPAPRCATCPATPPLESA